MVLEHCTQELKYTHAHTCVLGMLGRLGEKWEFGLVGSSRHTYNTVDNNSMQFSSVHEQKSKYKILPVPT